MKDRDELERENAPQVMNSDSIKRGVSETPAGGTPNFVKQLDEVGNADNEAVELAQLAREIRECHQNLIAVLRRTTKDGAAIGERLKKAQAKLLARGRKGEGFQQWVRQNCGFSVPTAYNYIAVYERSLEDPGILEQNISLLYRSGRIAATEDLPETPTATRNGELPADIVNVIDRYPELKKDLLQQIKNDSKVTAGELEEFGATKVQKKQEELKKNVGKLPASRMLDKDPDYDEAVAEVEPLRQAADREVIASLDSTILTLRFPFLPTIAHLENALRDLNAELRSQADAELAQGRQLTLVVSRKGGE